MISVRRARRGDFAAMRAVFRSAGREAWPHIIPPEGLDQLEPPARLRGRGGPRRAVFVAERDGVVVGFISVRPAVDDDAEPTTGEVDMLYTSPSAWGAGAGRALLAEGLRFLRNAGFREAKLWTAQTNHRPRRVYERYGFTLDGACRDREHLGGEFVELRYRFPLTG